MVRNYNKDRREEVINTYIDDSKLVDDVINNTAFALNDFDEATLKLMFTHKGQQKEKLQDAKGLKATQKKELQFIQEEQQQEQTNWQESQLEYLKSKTDFNQYLD
jgi:tRNA A37 threonylcarbamoyladenosine modification protein TsaB